MKLNIICMKFCKKIKQNKKLKFRLLRFWSFFYKPKNYIVFF